MDPEAQLLLLVVVVATDTITYNHCTTPDTSTGMSRHQIYSRKRLEGAGLQHCRVSRPMGNILFRGSTTYNRDYYEFE